MTDRTTKTVTIIGAGIGGLYLIAELGVAGFKLRLHDIDDAKLSEIRARGGVDVEGESAGFAAVEEMSLADWRRQTGVNLDGVFLSVKYAVPAMRRAGGGSIIIMSSVAGLRGSAGLAGYCATKGGVRLFAKAVATEWRQKAMVSGSTPSIPGSSTRRFGRSYRYPPEAMRRLIRTRLPKPGYLSEGPGRRRISQTVCCSSPRMRPAT